MVTAEDVQDWVCEKCDSRMVLSRGHYVCLECGYAPDEDDPDEDDGPRHVDELPW